MPILKALWFLWVASLALFAVWWVTPFDFRPVVEVFGPTAIGLGLVTVLRKTLTRKSFTAGCSCTARETAEAR